MAICIPAKRVEEKISLSERFGLWVSFYPFKQDDYLTIVAHWLRLLGAAKSRLCRLTTMPCAGPCSALRASGRVAWQFAKDLAGKKAR